MEDNVNCVLQCLVFQFILHHDLLERQGAASQAITSHTHPLSSDLSVTALVWRSESVKWICCGLSSSCCWGSSAELPHLLAGDQIPERIRSRTQSCCHILSLSRPCVLSHWWLIQLISTFLACLQLSGVCQKPIVYCLHLHQRRYPHPMSSSSPVNAALASLCGYKCSDVKL